MQLWRPHPHCHRGPRTLCPTYTSIVTTQRILLRRVQVKVRRVLCYSFSGLHLSRSSEVLPSWNGSFGLEVSRRPRPGTRVSGG